MKRKSLLLLFWLLLAQAVQSQIIDFPELNFKNKLLAASPSNTIAKNLSGAYFKIDSNNDGQIQVAEAAQVSFLDVSDSNISSLVGISGFSGLTELNCRDNALTTLDVTGLHNLQILGCAFNELTSLWLNESLLSLQCPGNHLSSLNLEAPLNLIYLECHNNLLTTLDLSHLSQLNTLSCGSNQLTSLDLSQVNNLTSLECTNNLLTALEVGNLLQLDSLYCFDNQISTLNLNGLSHLRILECFNNQLSSIALGGLSSLIHMLCFSNQLTTINGADLVHMKVLSCANNLLTTLDVSHMPELLFLNAQNNQLASLYIKNNAIELDLIFDGNQNLSYVCADPDQLTAVQNLITSYGYTNCTVDASCALANENFTQLSSCTVFPNPAVDFILVDFAAQRIPSLAIYNTSGQLVDEWFDVTQKARLDISTLPSGNYLIKFNADISSSIQKLIKK